MHALPARSSTPRARLAIRWFGPAATTAALAAALAMLGAAGQSDLEAELAAQAHYCAMVGDGHWPAYDDAIECDAPGAFDEGHRNAR